LKIIKIKKKNKKSLKKTKEKTVKRKTGKAETGKKGNKKSAILTSTPVWNIKTPESINQNINNSYFINN